MAVITKTKLNESVRKSLAKKKVESKYCDSVDFIIERYFHYMKLAVFHGYTVNAQRLMKFSLVYTFFDIVPYNIRKIVRFSSRAFGCWFYIKVQSSRMDKTNYIYKTDNNLLNEIVDYIDNDNIYKLIKE